MKFREWLEQESRKEKIIQAARDNSDEFPSRLVEFVSAALRVPPRLIRNAAWDEMINAFYEVVVSSPNVKIPLTEARVDSASREDWDYDGRTWHLYSHILAKAYGWTLEYISQLRVGEALAKIQEILTDEQLEREFQYSLSELAYVYDKSTKKSHFKPLPRPAWMRPAPTPVKRLKIPGNFLPSGEVNYDALPEELRPKEIIQ